MDDDNTGRGDLVLIGFVVMALGGSIMTILIGLIVWALRG